MTRASFVLSIIGIAISAIGIALSSLYFFSHRNKSDNMSDF